MYGKINKRFLFIPALTNFVPTNILNMLLLTVIVYELLLHFRYFKGNYALF